MKNWIKKCICMFLAGITTFSLASCKDDGSSDSSVSSVDNSSTAEPEKEFNPNHDFSYTETNDWLVKDGKSDYTVVVPTQTTALLSYAKTELVTLFKEATGVDLPVITDSELMTHTPTGKYISLGDTKLYETANLGIDKAPLIEDGVRIVTRDKTIYLVGGKDEGVLYAVYDFLKLNFNFETYYKNCYELDTGVRDVKLMKYDVTDIPDIPFRDHGMGAMSPISSDYDDVMFSYRMRSYDAYWQRILLIHEGWDKKSDRAADHNSFHFLPPSEYGESDPEFFSTQGNQLCFTARGDEAKYNRMLDLCLKKVVQSLQWYTPETNPDMNFVQIGMEDNLDWCACDACTKAIEKYGAKSATVLMFCNDLSDLINDWMAKEENKAYAREDFKVMFFAYQATLEPPFEWDEARQEYYTPYEEVIPNEDVTVFLAVSGFDHSRSIYSDRNAAMYENVKAWGQYMDDIFFWTYGGFIGDYFSFADIYNFYSEIYGFFHEVGGVFCLTQQHSSQKGADSAFFVLAGYVCTKMMWDSSLDINELIDDYMNAMYKEAAPAMKQLFNHERMRFNIQYTSFGWSWTAWWNKPSFSNQYWTVGYINEAFRLLDEAYDAIEKYKNDEDLYKDMKSRIDMEWLSPAKVAIDHYEENFTVEEYKAIKEKFKQVCVELGITNLGELDKIDGYLAGL